MKRCHECGGKFGLARLYCWGKEFCSRPCKQAYENRKFEEVKRRRLVTWLFQRP